jgi:hypothetical protein
MFNDGFSHAINLTPTVDGAQALNGDSMGKPALGAPARVGYVAGGADQHPDHLRDKAIALFFGPEFRSFWYSRCGPSAPSAASACWCRSSGPPKTPPIPATVPPTRGAPVTR